jgi:tripartite ATP-independent transporter DctM subunit
MNWALLVFFAGFIAIFVLRLPIAPGMLMTSIFYLVAAPGAGADVSMFAEKVLTNLEAKYIIIAVPLFVFMAQVMNSGKITDMIFRFANVLVGRRKGGLGHVNVVASIIFSGMTGSAVADASGLGLMEIKAMKEHGYEEDFSCAVTAASATIGPVFPPSIPMIFYAMLSGASIGNLFLGGMIPGLLIGAALMIYIAWVANKRDYPKGEKLILRDMIAVTIKAFPALFSVIVLLGGIYSGIVTPTEAGALASLYAIIVAAFIYRALGPKSLWRAVRDTVKTTGTLSLIVGCAFTFSFIVAREHIPQIAANFLLSVTSSRALLLLLINIVFLLLGMFIDTSTITVVFIPMVLPLVQALGIDLIHFGVVVVLNMMIGLSTPPFGMLLFIVSGISGAPIRGMIKEIFPMLIAMLIVLALVTFVPDIVLILPRLIGRY